jgi:Xaa-Pro aminopeptidase
MNEFPKIPESEFITRIDNFKKIMEREKIDMVVIYSNFIDPAGVRYFSNFSAVNESSAMLIPLKGEPILCSGQANHEWSKHTTYAIKDIRILPEVGEVSGVEYNIENQLDFSDLFKELKEKYVINKIGVIGDLIFPYIIYNKLINVYPKAEIISADNLLLELRIRKSENELNCIRKASEIISKAFEYTVSRIKTGVTELDIAADIQSEILRLGAEGNTISWAPMIQSGKENSNLCVNLPSRRRVNESEIINLQAGACYEGYNGVISTPLVLGKIPNEIKEAVKVLYEALKITESVIKPGVTSVQVFEKYISFLKDRGYGDYVPYGPLHSLGMLECETPFFSIKREVPIIENMTIAIDAYLKNLPWGSFRIENTYIINSNGVECVTDFNEKFIGATYK